MQAFLDRDGAVGSLMGFKGPTWVWGHGDSWLGHGDLKLGPCSDLGPFKKKVQIFAFYSPALSCPFCLRSSPSW